MILEAYEEGRKEGKREGRKEGEKERKEGRKGGGKEAEMVSFLSTHPTNKKEYEAFSISLHAHLQDFFFLTKIY